MPTPRSLLVLLCALLALGCPSSRRAAPSEPRLLRHAYADGEGGERDAWVYLPAGYDSEPEARWPVLLFLHGDGERGDGRDELDWVLLYGPVYEAWIQKRDLPFVIVTPQLPLFGRDQSVDYIRDRDPATIPARLEEGTPPRPGRFRTRGPMRGATPDRELPFPPRGPADGWPRVEESLVTLLDGVLSGYRADPDRVYLSGVSYGGFGTWWLASRHPERFAAIAPVVAWGHPALTRQLAEHRVAVWVFAGGRDPVYPARYFYPGVNALERHGAGVRFTVHEDVGHDVWNRVYPGRDLYDWLLSHRRGG